MNRNRLFKIKQESLTTIGNRFLRSISEEIRLLPNKVKQLKEDENYPVGLILCNLISPCNMFIKYWSEKLAELGFDHIVHLVIKLNRQAKEMELWLNGGGQNDDITWQSIIKDLEDFNDDAQKLPPILFLL
jgi:hypothetical protein